MQNNKRSTPGAAAAAEQEDERTRRNLWGQFYRRVKAKAPAHILHAFMQGGRDAKNELFRAWRETGGAEWATCTLQVAKCSSRTSDRSTTRSLKNRDMLLRQYCGNEEIVDRIIANCKARGAVAAHPDLPDEMLYAVWTGAEERTSENLTEKTRIICMHLFFVKSAICIHRSVLLCIFLDVTALQLQEFTRCITHAPKLPQPRNATGCSWMCTLVKMQLCKTCLQDSLGLSFFCF